MRIAEWISDRGAAPGALEALSVLSDTALGLSKTSLGSGNTLLSHGEVVVVMARGEVGLVAAVVVQVVLSRLTGRAPTTSASVVAVSGSARSTGGITPAALVILLTILGAKVEAGVEVTLDVRGKLLEFFDTLLGKLSLLLGVTGALLSHGEALIQLLLKLDRLF